MNQTCLIGRLTKDVELKYTPANQAVAQFILAVNRPFKNANGEREADFINCVIWRQAAENLANWAKKGNLIGITGRIQVRNYENQQGQRVYITEVVADNVLFLESRATRESQGDSTGGDHKASQGNSNNNSYGSSTQQNSVPDFGRNDSDPFGGGSPVEISESDLPF